MTEHPDWTSYELSFVYATWPKLCGELFLLLTHKLIIPAPPPNLARHTPQCVERETTPPRLWLWYASYRLPLLPLVLICRQIFSALWTSPFFNSEAISTPYIALAPHLTFHLRRLANLFVCSERPAFSLSMSSKSIGARRYAKTSRHGWTKLARKGRRNSSHGLSSAFTSRPRRRAIVLGLAGEVSEDILSELRGAVHKARVILSTSLFAYLGEGLQIFRTATLEFDHCSNKHTSCCS